MTMTLADLLRFAHPARSKGIKAESENTTTRSIDGIRLKPAQGTVELHAVGLSLARLCQRDCQPLPTPSSPCACFGPVDLGATSAYLSKNELTAAAVAPLAGFSELKVLSLADNKIERVPDCLRALGKLKRLSVARNPVMGRPYALEQILAFVPSLRELNGRHISEAEARRGRAVYRIHVVLRNLVYLLGLVQKEEPGAAWVEALKSVERVLVGGVSTSAAQAVSQLADEYFLLDSDPDQEERGSVTSNHGLAVEANAIWVDSIAFSMSDNDQGDEGIESLLLEVTQSLVSLEALCREEASRAEEVDAQAMAIWRAVFGFRDLVVARQRAEAAAAAEAVDQTAPENENDNEGAVDRLEKERDALAEMVGLREREAGLLRAQRDEALEACAGLRSKVEDLEKGLATAGVQREGYRRQTEEAAKKDEIGRSQQHAVIEMLSEQLEASKRRAAAVAARNEELVIELDAALRARSAAMEAQTSAESSAAEARSSGKEALRQQKASFESVLRELHAELEALRSEPRVPVNIEVVTPDVTRAIDERDGRIASLTEKLAAYERDQWQEATARSYREEKARERVSIAAAFCFRGWMGYTRRRRATTRLEASLSSIGAGAGRASAVHALTSWRAHTRTRRVAAALAAVRQTQASSETMRRVFRGWSELAAQRKRVDAFVGRRSSRTVRRALVGLAGYAFHRQESIRSAERAVALRSQTATLADAFRSWHDGAVASRRHREEATASCVAFLFAAWIRATREMKQQRALELAADRHSTKRLQRSALQALGAHAAGVYCRRSTVDALELGRRRDLMLDALDGWRDCLKAGRADRARQRAHARDTMRATIAAWRSHAFVSTKARIVGLQVVAILARTTTEQRTSDLKQRLHEASEAFERTESLALSMAASFDALQRRLSEADREHRRAVYTMAEKHSRLARAHRTTKRLLNNALHEARELEAARAEQAAAAASSAQARAAAELALDRSLDENRHLSLRLRASDAVKSSAQTRATKEAAKNAAKAVRRSDAWSLGAAWPV